MKKLRKYQYRDRENCLIKIYMHSGADAAQIETATQGCGHSRAWSKGLEKKRKTGHGNLEMVQGDIDIRK